jgi:hypothetical protein
VCVTDARDRSGAAYMAPDARRHQQAQRDLRDLVSSGTLQPVGRTRARFYVAGSGFPTVLWSWCRRR